ncbi:hypothetical protein [Nocardioides plantarum]|uniref:Uncharacterized protein n=1 Tax=Nocardioides plantarum TaxID=29299 RepID=A0ABV5K6B4_9ACTN|nr:hypothetical protein [Nocardioides plantarum]
MTTQRAQQSTRLRADVALHATVDGHVLRVGDTHLHVHLSASDAEALLDALVAGGRPTSRPARTALDSLVDAGLVDAPVPHHHVIGDGVLAQAVAGALQRMGATVGPGGTTIAVLDSPDDLGSPGPACWMDGHLVVLAPPAVTALDVVARRRAATRHRDHDPRVTPVAGGRAVTAPTSRPGLELAAAVVAAELLSEDRPAHHAVSVDLRTRSVTRHPVLPVPSAPR